ncbi:pyrimidine utilization protein D (plasmid) [Sphingobium sp. SJ10-10]|uniref:pyrimidine utilization protein D n=1 Tax=Sphingobium sp. SJ10-10 TaxID=3114999 RepID=UPI002E17F129|nr:pyrimidine utilization protein D [Sphingobium sp. SJ10-10]
MSDPVDLPFTQSEIDGLAVRCFGASDAPAVLLSAGLGGAGAYWHPQIEALARDHCVILYDHRGTGNSSRAPLPSPYDATYLATDIRLILDGLGLSQAHIVGHAAGGIAGLEFIRLWPDRAASLTIVNGWAKADPHFERCFDIRLAIHAAGGADAYSKAQPLFLYPATWISEHLAELDEERIAHAPGFQDEATLKARIAALRAFDARAMLTDITVPTLIITSEDDMLVPSTASRTLADGIASAQVARLPWGGHAVNVTDPGRFNAILIGFLDEHRHNKAQRAS